jgi:branched-chain amino acid transport system permease protein
MMPARWTALRVRVAGVLICLVLADLGWERLVPDSALRQLVLLACCNVVVALSLNVVSGMAGQLSLGHAGFLALGAYSAAIVASHLHAALGGGEPTFLRSLIVVPAALLVAAVVAGLFGFLVGLPSLRLKGDYLAIVTLGFAEIVRLVIATAQIGGSPETIAQAWSRVGQAGQTGQATPSGYLQAFLHTLGVAVGKLGGVNGYAGLAEGGVPLYAGPFWILGMTGLLFLVAWRLKWSGWGRALRALREDEIAAAAVGVDPTRYKVNSFVLSAMGGGLAGAMIALERDGSPIVQPDSFGFAASFDAITMVILGGSGSVTGAAIGALLVTLSVKAIELAQHTAAVSALGARFASLDLNALRMMVYAAALIALMIKRPEGLLGERELWADRGTARGKRTGEKGATGAGASGASG